MTDDLRVRLARERADYDICVFLQRAVWALEDLEITSAIQMIGSCHAGGFVQIAETPEGQAVGFGYAFPAFRNGLSYLHSDMLAVLPDHQKQGVGVRLKWAQRDEALRRGHSLITWTYDPLQARNANLNLRRLGGTAVEYLPNFYGITTSTLHHGLPTDRLLVHWDLNGERARERAGGAEPPSLAPTPSLPRINEVKWQAGWPVSSEPQLDLEAPALLLEIPPDWDVLCRAAPRVAEGWQDRAARAFQNYLSRGYIVADFAPTEDGGRRRPLYILYKA